MEFRAKLAFVHTGLKQKSPKCILLISTQLNEHLHLNVCIYLTRINTKVHFTYYMY